MRKVVAADDESYVRDKKPLPLRLLSWERFLRLLVCKFLFHYLKISVCNATEDSTWISNSDDIVGNIFGNYAAGADNGIRADFDTGKPKYSFRTDSRLLCAVWWLDAGYQCIF